MNGIFLFAIPLVIAGLGVTTTSGAQVTEDVLNSISTPNKVETAIGILEFLDGAPLPETAEKVYDYLDTMRAADTFMNGMPGPSLKALIDGAHSLGAVKANEVMIFDKLMDAKSLFLTANSSTVYAVPDLDVTVYDPQTHSMLQNSQMFPTVDGQTEGIKTNDDGSFTLYSGPKAPMEYEHNRVEAIPGKSWFVILRM